MRRFFLGLAISGIATLAPAWALAGDQETAQQVAANLKTSGTMKGYSIGVKVSDGTAWLAGTVSSQQQLASALRIAEQTPGIKSVVNELSVQDQSAASPATTPRVAKSESLLKRAFGSSASRQAAASRPAIDRAVKQVSTYEPVAPMPETMAQASPPMLSEAAGPTMPAPGFAPTVSTRKVSAEAPAPRQLSNDELTAQNRQLMAQNQQLMAHQQIAHQRMAMAQRMPPQGGVQQAGGVPPPGMMPPGPNAPMPAYHPGAAGALPPARYDNPQLPNYAWPSYAAHPNYAALTYPKQYSPTAWPFIGPFYPYPQVPLGWRKVTLEWDDGWWMLDFKD